MAKGADYQPSVWDIKIHCEEYYGDEPGEDQEFNEENRRLKTRNQNERGGAEKEKGPDRRTKREIMRARMARRYKRSAGGDREESERIGESSE